MAFCMKCGSAYKEGQRFCIKCGAALPMQPLSQPQQPVRQTPQQQPVYQQPMYQPRTYQQPVRTVQPIYQQPAAGGSKALAITALILGICGLVFCWIPVFGLLIAVAGLIVGIFALKNPNGKGMGITGFVLSIVGIVIGLSYTIALFGSSSAFSRNYSSLSRSLSRSRSRASSISRSLSRKRQYDIVAPDANLYIDGYVVSFGE